MQWYLVTYHHVTQIFLYSRSMVLVKKALFAFDQYRFWSFGQLVTD